MLKKTVNWFSFRWLLFSLYLIHILLHLLLPGVLRPNLINLSCVAELPTAGSNLNHQFRIKDFGRIWMIQIWAGGWQFTFIKFSPCSPDIPRAATKQWSGFRALASGSWSPRGIWGSAHTASSSLKPPPRFQNLKGIQ